MQNFIETCSLVLSDNDISTSDQATSYPLFNNIGSINEIRSDRTWLNINLREVVGPELYENYNYFNLRLNALAYLPAGTTFGATANDRLLNIFMEGVPFCNNTYSAVSKYNTNRACVGNMVIQNLSSSVSNIYDSTWLVTFYKAENINIRLYFEKVDKTSINIGTTATLFPRFTFYFSIFPVK